MEVTDEASLMSVVRHDYVCAEYQDGYRSNDTFISSDEPEYPDDDDEATMSFEDDSDIAADDFGTESEPETEPDETTAEEETEEDIEPDEEMIFDSAPDIAPDADSEPEPTESDEAEESESLTPDLFIKLKNLSEYLPLEKRREFLKSRENLQLEYLIRKLGGAQGFLKSASSMRPDLNAASDDSSHVTLDEIRGIFDYVKSLLPSLPDSNLADVLREEMDRVLEKL